MNDQYPTPQWLMSMFGDWYDPCPLNVNPYFDGLKVNWHDKTYVNPPYSSPLKWVIKAIEELKADFKVIADVEIDTIYLEDINIMINNKVGRRLDGSKKLMHAQVTSDGDAKTTISKE